jgi:glycosyltransferase involved in cell wall biosynthesis
VAVCFRVNKVIVFVIQLLDNIVMQLADFIIFPDKQYFNYYGFFKLKSSKYFILPNSTSDQYELISDEDIYTKYNIARGKILIPILGYFSETRGREVFYSIIKEKIDSVHYIIAGDFRDTNDVNYFESMDNVTFLGKVSYVEALFIMKNASFTPLLYDPSSLNNKYAYPTKYYDSLMVGTPLLVSKGQSDIWNEIVELNMGYGMEYNSLSDFKELLLELVKVETKIDKQRLRDIFLSKYDFNIFKNNLRQVYFKLKNN